MLIMHLFVFQNSEAARTGNGRSHARITVQPDMHHWKIKLLQVIVTLTGVIILLLNFKSQTKLGFSGQPDILPYRIKLREVRGELVWPALDVSVRVGLPISHIRDLGENKSRVLLVVIVSAAPLRRERRDAIRQTWWRHCNASEVSEYV